MFHLIACCYTGLLLDASFYCLKKYGIFKIKIPVQKTLIFAPGVNKANVRYIIHRTIPSSADDYWQACGRAGYLCRVLF